MKYLMVLNDGETFTDIEDCYVLAVPDDFDDDTLPENAVDDSIVYFNHDRMHIVHQVDMRLTEHSLQVLFK